MASSYCKKFSALFCKITSKYDKYFYCLNCLDSFSKENKLTNMKMYVKIMILVI